MKRETKGTTVMTQPASLNSLGFMTSIAGAPIAEVETILRDIGARPSFLINGLPHYSGEVFATVIARINGRSDTPAYHKTFFEEVRS